MSNIVEVIVDPILGDDNTGSPVANASVDHFYKTLDAAINDNPVYDLLIIRVNKGNVEMNQLSYRNIEINKVVNDSKLIIHGHVGATILFTNVTLNINTEILLPEDNISDPNTDPDVPVISLEENVLYLLSGNDFSVTDIISSPELINRGRIIIFSFNGLILIDNDDGTIDVSSRDVIVIQGDVITYINGFSEMLTTDHFILNNLHPGAFSHTGDSKSIDWTYNVLDRPAVNVKKNITHANGFIWPFVATGPVGMVLSLLAVILGGPHPKIEVNTGSTKLSTNTASTNLLVSTASPQIDFFAYQKITILVPPNKSVNNKNKNKIFKLEDYKGKASILLKKFKLNAILEEDEVSITGTFLRNSSPDFLNAYVTNAPADVTTLSLHDVEILSPEVVTNLVPTQLSVLEGLDYNNKFESNSYNNNGSIFREVKLIQSNYTHTRFDGNVFVVDASGGNIFITIPVDTLKNRLFTYKRIDTSNNSVIITTPNGIDLKKSYKLKNKSCDKTGKASKKHKLLGRVKLVGYNDKLWVI